MMDDNGWVKGIKRPRNLKDESETKHLLPHTATCAPVAGCTMALLAT